MADVYSKEFDPNDVTITIDSPQYGTFAVLCLGEDMVKCSKDENSASASVGAQGDTIINKSQNHLGTITMTVQAQSPQLPTMKKMAKNASIFGIWVVNRSTGEKTGGTQAFFKKPADNETGKELKDREYEIQVLDYVDE